ncbi:unnamed protein product [Adineta steineri]|uniref:Autophagy-related protein 27 n=1 Tax=Adineta steineri TaxID=433720 RepID=A0A814BE90_9BILA|nr:unnamed protein product [Adineta steineri]CAF0942654.1 unnamed protein product [Adineta steineri]CAF3851533.1 unnamed protein product [Adineta steineri]CAF4156831.1 unnamed protein product [Adineta steineri]
MNILKNIFSILLFVLALCLRDQLNARTPCIYDLNPKGIIDLTSVGRMDGTPAWKNVHPEISDKHVYSYNPCHSFTQYACIDVAACQSYETDEKLVYSLGNQNSMQWEVQTSKDIVTLVYNSGERKLSVYLNCLKPGEPNKLEVHGYDSVAKIFTMTLSSECACWDGCKNGPTPPKLPNKLGGGAVFILILVILAMIYLIGFMTFNKFQRHESGINILPHRQFWISLPGYALDGILFTLRKVTSKGTTYTAV